jgi:integrase
MSGHIRRRGTRSWELKYDAGRDVTGKRKTRYASFKGTRREAEVELARLVAEHAAGASVDPSRITTAEFLDKWDADFAALNVTAKTRERYLQLIRNQIKPYIGGLQMQKLRPVHLADLYGKLCKAGLSARTAGHVHRLLHRVLGHATMWGIVQQNVAALVKPPKVDDVEILILTAEQVGRLLRHVDGRTLRPILALALATGARRGELLALRIGDFDADASTIRIARSIEQTKAGGLRLKPPKTRNGRRLIAIPKSMAGELRTHIVKMQEQRLALGLGGAGPDDLLFPTWDGRVRSPHWLTQKFAQVMMVLKIKGVTLHALRHTHASQLIAAGVDVLTISRRLGHGSPAITLAVYGHLFGNTDARAAELTEALFAGTD